MIASQLYPDSSPRKAARWSALLSDFARRMAGMRGSAAVLSDMEACLLAINDIAGDNDIPREEISLRLSQYAACAVGDDCPEIAFHPVAIRLQRIAAYFRRASPKGALLGLLWAARVRGFIEDLLG